MKNDKLPYHAQFAAVREGSDSADDDQTVVVNFKSPAPRFKFEVLSLKFDTGIPIVPEHVLEQGSRCQRLRRRPGHAALRPVQHRELERQPEDLSTCARTGGRSRPALPRCRMSSASSSSTSAVRSARTWTSVAQRVVNNEFDCAAGHAQRRSSATSWSRTPRSPPHRQRAAVRLPGLVAELAVDEHPDRAVQRPERAQGDQPDDRPRHRSTRWSTKARKIANDLSLPALPGPAGVCRLARSEGAGRQVSAAQVRPGGERQADDGRRLHQERRRPVGEGRRRPSPASSTASKASTATSCRCWWKCCATAASMPSINFGTDAYQNMADGKPGFYMFGHGASLMDPYAAFELFHSRYSAADRHHRRQQPLLALQQPRVRRDRRRDGARCRLG